MITTVRAFAGVCCLFMFMACAIFPGRRSSPQKSLNEPESTIASLVPGISIPVRGMRQEINSAEATKFFEAFAAKPQARGNIYFIFSDTVRWDYIRKYASTISTFMDENLGFKGISMSPATNLSTYSIFNSQPSHLVWKHMLSDGNAKIGDGALGLRMLKKGGYSINLVGKHFYCLDTGASSAISNWGILVESFFGHATYLRGPGSSSFLAVQPFYYWGEGKAIGAMTLANKDYKIWIRFAGDGSYEQFLSARSFSIVEITDPNDQPFSSDPEFLRFPRRPGFSLEEDAARKINEDFRDALCLITTE